MLHKILQKSYAFLWSGIAERTSLVLALWLPSLQTNWTRVFSSGLIPNTPIRTEDWLSERCDLLISAACEGWQERFGKEGLNHIIVNLTLRPERHQVLTSFAEGYQGNQDKNDGVSFHQIGDQTCQDQSY